MVCLYLLYQSIIDYSRGSDDFKKSESVCGTLLSIEYKRTGSGGVKDYFIEIKTEKKILHFVPIMNTSVTKNIITNEKPGAHICIKYIKIDPVFDGMFILEVIVNKTNYLTQIEAKEKYLNSSIKGVLVALLVLLVILSLRINQLRKE